MATLACQIDKTKSLLRTIHAETTHHNISSLPSRMVCWSPPVDFDYKLNTDRSSLGNPSQAGIDRLIRDNLGN